MRIRQVRPEFFTDPVIAALPPAVSLTYIGLWCVADDAGYFKVDLPAIGALLYPFRPVKRRQEHLASALDTLEKAGRLVRYRDCGCAEIPTLRRHQRVTGKQNFTAQETHGKHRLLTDKQRPLSDSPVTERNVTVGNGTVEGFESEPPTSMSEFQRRVQRPSA